MQTKSKSGLAAADLGRDKMAKQQYYATRDFRYQTRMLRAGDPVEMTGPVARLYRALGDVTLEKPKKAVAPKVEEAETEAPKKPAAPKAGAKARAKKATAKK